MNNAIYLDTEEGYRRAIDIEAEIITETGFKSPRREKLVTYPPHELVDEIKKRLTEEGIVYY